MASQSSLKYFLCKTKMNMHFAKIHVSTDCENVAIKTKEYGLEIDFPRPTELADDHTPLFSVLKFVMSKYRELGEQFDEAWLLMPCAP